MDEGEIFNMYREVLRWRARRNGPLPFTKYLADPYFHTGTEDNDQKLLRELIAFYVIFEGIFFLCRLHPNPVHGRRQQDDRNAEQFQYILRDESMHMNFGIDVINQIKIENPGLWTESFKAEMIRMIREAVEIETQYAYDTMLEAYWG